MGYVYVGIDTLEHVPLCTTTRKYEFKIWLTSQPREVTDYMEIWRCDDGVHGSAGFNGNRLVRLYLNDFD